MERTLSTKGMILDICSMRTRAIQLLQVEADYNSLLKYLTDKDYYSDDSLSIPTLKEVSASINITYDKTRILIKKLYARLVTDDDHTELKFKYEKVEYWVYAKGIYKSIAFQLENMLVVPRKEETMIVPYFKEYLGTDFFHIHNISYYMEDNRQIVSISLKRGAYNSYWDLRKDQAEETGEISMHDSLMKNDREIKEMLNLKPGKAW